MNAKEQANAVNTAYILLVGAFCKEGQSVEDLSEDVQHMFWHLMDAQITLMRVHAEKGEG